MHDLMLEEFAFNSELHTKVVEHLQKKGCPLNELTLFVQPETWEVLANEIANGNFHFQALVEGYVDKRNGLGMSYAQAEKRNWVDVRKIYMFPTTLDKAVAHMLYLIYYKHFIKLSHEIILL